VCVCVCVCVCVYVCSGMGPEAIYVDALGHACIVDFLLTLKREQLPPVCEAPVYKSN